MTNIELNNLFLNLNIECDNIFDVYEKLVLHEEEYKDMSIARILPTIYDAYELYCKHEDKIARIVGAIANADWSKLIDGLDIEKMLDKMPKEYKEVIEQLLKDASNNI